MTLLEKIESWIIPNTSRLISALKLREILIDVADALAIAGGSSSEQTTATWSNAADIEVEVSHSLNSINVDVHIFIADGLEKINPSTYEIYPVDNSNVRVRKTVLGAWTGAKVIIQKLV